MNKNTFDKVSFVSGGIRSTIKKMFSILPANSAEFIYTKLLKPYPLRLLANSILLKIIPKQVSLAEGVLDLHPHDPVVSGALAFNVYEKFQVDLFRSVLKPGMVVIDIGANIGLYTVIGAFSVGQNGHVYAFEPENENRKILEHNVRQNGFKNVTIEALAVSDENGTKTFYLASDNKGKHSFLEQKGGSKITVPTEKLDAYVHKYHINHVDIIKMDIEGAEPLALAGMTETLSNFRPTLFIEFYPDALRQIGNNQTAAALLTQLTAFGYKIFEINEKSQKIEPVLDSGALIHRLKKGQYTNLYCKI